MIEQHLGGSDDPKIAQVCLAESRVLITLDIGFGDIRSYPPRDHTGMIVLRPRQQDKLSVLALANRLITALRDHAIDRELWIVDDRKIRIRS